MREYLETLKKETFEDASHSFVNKLLIAMAFKVAIGALLTAINKRLCFEKGINNPKRNVTEFLNI